MNILTAMIFFEGEGGIYKSDAIFHDGKYWLVPYWIGSQANPKSKPVRIILIDAVPHQVHLGSAFGDLMINTPIPRALYEGRAQPAPESGLVVIENPDIPAQDSSVH